MEGSGKPVFPSDEMPGSANRPPSPPPEAGSTRRTFLLQVAGAGAVALVQQKLGLSFEANPGPKRSLEQFSCMETIVLNVNGQRRELRVLPETTLLDALREKLDLTGSKKGCDHGQCGACTVLINGRRINACLTLAVMHTDDEITTIEGLAAGDSLHPVQAAFLKHDAF
jgi:xanthine dehydrogenase YagT iron-sulfur-binding subunit